MSLRSKLLTATIWKNKKVNAIKREWKSIKSYYVKSRRCKLLFDNFNEEEIRKMATVWASNAKLETKLDNVTMTEVIKDIAKTKEEIKFVRKVWGKQSKVKEQYYNILINE